MDHLLTASYFLSACMVTAANPFLTITLIVVSYFNNNIYDLVILVTNGFKSTLYIIAWLSPILIILFAVSRLSKWLGI
jgi:hypothetical protein